VQAVHGIPLSARPTMQERTIVGSESGCLRGLRECRLDSSVHPFCLTSSGRSAADQHAPGQGPHGASRDVVARWVPVLLADAQDRPRKDQVSSEHLIPVGCDDARPTVDRGIPNDPGAVGRLPSRRGFWHAHPRSRSAQTRENPSPPTWARAAHNPQGWPSCGRASDERTGRPPAGEGPCVQPRMTATGAAAAAPFTAVPARVSRTGPQSGQAPPARAVPSGHRG
jgi:hypothetical protein